MKSYNELIKSRNIPQLFLFGMYRSGTTVLARSLAGDSKIAFVSDPIRPFFNWYRTKLQRQVNPFGFEDNSRPLGDYFNSDKEYITKLLRSNFSETISLLELSLIRKTIIDQSLDYSPKFVNSLKKSTKVISSCYADELKHYLSLIMLTYGNSDTRLLGLKEVWSIEMAFPIINMLGKSAKILVVLRDPLDIAASSIAGTGNYSILTLARQWRKQIVFYNLLKTMYPSQVTSIKYEDFCTDPINTLKNSFKKLFSFSNNFFSKKLKPVDDSGNAWLKNSSHLFNYLTKEIDKESLGKYKKILKNNEIEWLRYLTYMQSYVEYNSSNKTPSKPTSSFPKRDILHIADWAKLDMTKIEGKNLKNELQSEYNRIRMINSMEVGQKEMNENSIVFQI